MHLQNLALPTSLLLLCAGCCTFNCNINDLAFTSLEKPRPEEILTAGASFDHYRALFKPNDLKLRFSTERNLLRLEKRNDTNYPQLYVTRCGDKSGIVSITPIYSDDGRSMDRLAYFSEFIRAGVKLKDPAVPPEPVLKPTEDGRFIYEAAIHLKNVMLSDSGKFGHGHEFLPLPTDPHELPEFCFRVISGSFLSIFHSNDVRLPLAAVIDIIQGVSRPSDH